MTGGQESLIAAAKQSIADLYPRPTTVSYQELSAILQKRIQEVLLGKSSPEDAMKQAAKDAERLH